MKFIQLNNTRKIQNLHCNPKDEEYMEKLNSLPNEPFDLEMISTFISKITNNPNKTINCVQRCLDGSGKLPIKRKYGDYTNQTENVEFEGLKNVKQNQDLYSLKELIRKERKNDKDNGHFHASFSKIIIWQYI